MYIFNGGFTNKNKGAKSIDIFVAEKNITPELYFTEPKKFSNKLIYFFI